MNQKFVNILGTFSCVASHNSNWDEYKPNLNKFTKYDARVAKILASPNFKLSGYPWMKDIVYYHDKSVSKPKSWDNKYYKTAITINFQKVKQQVYLFS